MRVRRDAGMETYAWRDHPRIVTIRVPVRVGRSHASPRSSLACQPRVSGSTVPYEVIFDHFETVLATLAADPTAKGLPGYVTMRWLGESQDTIAEPLFHQRRDLPRWPRSRSVRVTIGPASVPACRGVWARRSRRSA
jgi:hypothetical protein